MEVPILRLDYDDEDFEFIQKGMVEILKSGYLTMGDKVAAFEEQFAEFVGSRYAIGVNSGTSALEIPLRALDVTGKTVIVPTITFMATPLAAIHAGARVEFVDVSPDTLSIDPDDLAGRLRDDTAAVIPVHIGGIISSDWDRIEQICTDADVPIVEDAAHAHGAAISGRKAGTLGISAGFSFYPTKVLNTAEGGMITTDDEAIFEKSRVLREHGKADHRFNVHTDLGYNWRFSELHALLGLQQMRKARAIVNERIRIAGWYDDQLKDLDGIRLVEIPPEIICPYYKYIVYLEPPHTRDTVKRRMQEEFKVSLTGEVYADPCHTQPVFDRYPDLIIREGEYPGAEYVSSCQICLPIYPGLREDEADYVVESLKQVLRTA